MRAIAVAATAALVAGIFHAGMACTPLVPPAVRAEVAGWTMSCPPRDAGAPCSLERVAERTRLGVWVSSTETEVMFLNVLAPVTRMTLRIPDAEPIEATCVTSHAMCEPELISRCQVPLGRADALTDVLAAGRDVAVVLDGTGGVSSRVLDATGFAAAWARYDAMIRDQRGRAFRWFIVPEPSVRRGSGRG
jgi:hypothetical protein